MAIVTAPTLVSNLSYMAWAGKSAVLPSGPPIRADKNVVRVGSVLVAPGDNTTVPLGGSFDVWYDKAAHSLLIDIASAQVGGPV